MPFRYSAGRPIARVTGSLPQTCPPGAKRGIFALQLHSGGPMEVRFKDLKLELNPKLDQK